MFFIRAMLKGESERSGEECRLRCTCWERCCAALFYRLLQQQVASLGVLSQLNHGLVHPQLQRASPPTQPSRLQISINEIKVVLSRAFIYGTRDFRQTERKKEAQ